ncbi:hypothetical protein [Streptomyces sp. NPDC086989]|uniref:hypothetical protein n=1 Tax=Streptomyces sp. NPDC086989 TaxID=3365764 RepID=UPI0037FD2821
MARPRRPHRYLRDVTTVCTATSPCPGGDFRCELDAGHEGRHKDGCTHWGQPATNEKAES